MSKNNLGVLTFYHNHERLPIEAGDWLQNTIAPDKPRGYFEVVSSSAHHIAIGACTLNAPTEDVRVHDLMSVGF